MFGQNFKLELKNTVLLAIPIIIAQLGVVLMGVTDNMIVGRLLDKVALGSAGIANSIAFLIASLAVGGMSVISPMVAKSSIEKNQTDLKALFSSTFWVCVIYSLALSFIGFLFYYNFDKLGQPVSINAQAPMFLLIILLSNIPLVFFVGYKQFSDGLSKPKVSMYITLVGLGVNILGNFILIKGFGSIKALGLLGSAWATFITRSLMFLVLWIYLKRASLFKSTFGNAGFLFFKKQISVILNRSIPSGFQFFFEIAAFSIAIIMMGWISEIALAAHQIAINIASITYMMASGFSYAGAIRVGVEWGMKSKTGIITAGYAAYFVVLVFMTAAMLTILAFDVPLLSAFINDKEVILQAIPLLSIAAYFQLSDGVQLVGLGVLRGLADIKIPTLITFLAYWVIALPVGYYLGFKIGLAAIGIWYGLLLGLSFSAILLFLRFKNIVSRKNLKKRFAKIEA